MELSLLQHPRHVETPFSCWVDVDALPELLLRHLEALFDQEVPWERRDGPDYQVELADITERLDPRIATAVVERARALLGMDLSDRVELTIQRMRTGQRVGVHTDPSWPGLEAARLLLYLGPPCEGGGLLALHANHDAPPIATVAPQRNTAVLLPLSADSHHSVTEVQGERRLLIFNLWHRQNDGWVPDALETLLGQLDLRSLPRALDPIAAEAEASLPEERTLRSAIAAWLLVRWGAAEPMILASYQRDLTDDAPRTAPEHLARWAASLHCEGLPGPCRWPLRDAGG